VTGAVLLHVGVADHCGDTGDRDHSARGGVPYDGGDGSSAHRKDPACHSNASAIVTPSIAACTWS
jgi:hypothetical protein